MINNLPWIEKYRAKTFSDIINHDDDIKAIKNLIDNKSLTNMLFYGPPGTGKTSLVLAIARYLYGPDSYKKYIIEINASSDRGIDTIKTTIKDFVKIKFDNIKLVILDEIDSMTHDAQGALRGIIEEYSIYNRFFLICNNIEKIIPALISRCLPIKFTTPISSIIKEKIKIIIETEKINISDDAIDILIGLDKDLRQIINYLQGIHNLYTDEIITSDKMNKYLGIPNKKDIETIYESLLTKDFETNYKILIDMFKSAKWSINEFIKYIFKQLLIDDVIEINKKYLLIKDLSKIENRVKTGGDSEIQLAFIAISFNNNNL
jgi:replication factor C subunit 3/5